MHHDNCDLLAKYLNSDGGRKFLSVQIMVTRLQRRGQNALNFFLVSVLRQKNMNKYGHVRCQCYQLINFIVGWTI